MYNIKDDTPTHRRLGTRIDYIHTCVPVCAAGSAAYCCRRRRTFFVDSWPRVNGVERSENIAYFARLGSGKSSKRRVGFLARETVQGYVNGVDSTKTTADVYNLISVLLHLTDIRQNAFLFSTRLSSSSFKNTTAYKYLTAKTHAQQMYRVKLFDN